MPDTIAEALGLPERGLLSLVGAGGKTTVMFRLAAELTARGLRVACATTTKIFPPSPDQARIVLAENNEHFLDACRESMAQGRPVCVAWRAESGKLLGLPPEFIHRLLDSGICDWVLVEADGARGLPLKAPAEHEPVIPERSTHVLALAGLTAIGTALDEAHVCRSGRYAELSGLPPNAPVTPESVARVCNHPHGMFKGAPANARCMLWLNQADTPNAFAHGHEILDRIGAGECVPKRVVVGAAMCVPCVMEVWEP
jgi:probable selenium-dependent hydroxylase accessory protein YqeC